MGKLFILSVAVLVVSLVIVSSAAKDDCPISSKVSQCNPKCKGHSDCHGQKCCRNICGTMSCLPQHLDDSKNGGGYKNQNSKGATGTYCGNVKCNAYEKCELDRSSKREKCVRS